MHRHASLKKRYSGFTLIEVIIAVAIVGILAAGVFVAVDPVQIIKKSRDSVRFSDINNIKKAIELYMVDKGHAPYLQGSCGPSTPSADCFANDTGGSPYPWSDLEKDLAPYFAELPTDVSGAEGRDENGFFFSYNYYAPGSYVAACDQGACSCAGFAKEAMYSLYAEKLETTSGGFGIARNPFGSY